jgi:hypothetical protein
MAHKELCPICSKRRAERFCPAKDEKICAIDCGTGREVTIDCPSGCTYLVAARRWEENHPQSLSQNDMPFPDVSFPASLVHTRQAVLSGIGYTVVMYAREQGSLVDADVFAAARALAETYRTLTSGIYFEKQPEGIVAAGLYAALAKYLDDGKKQEAEHPESPAVTNSEIFHLLVFFLRFGILRSNGRPRTRAFLEFLRAQMPPETGLAKEESRIIIP